MFITLFYAVIGLYFLAVSFFIIGLFLEEKNHSSTQPFITVVLPAKNERDHIHRILREVVHQTYPKEKYEVIVVDDESTDITPNVTHAFMEKYDNVHFLSTEGSASPLRNKKRPLDIGIRSARGEIILLTDADCHISSQWIESMVSCFTPDTGLVIGHAEIDHPETAMQQIEALDFLLLMGAARGTASLGFPFACTGQNLAYRKEVFEQAGGFSSFADAAGGDDNLLLQNIKQHKEWTITTAFDRASYVSTPPLPNLRPFISQRIRWAADSLSVRQTDMFFFFVIIVTFLANLLILLLAASLLFSLKWFFPFILALGLKFIVEGLLMLRTTSLFERFDMRRSFPIWFFSQIPYVVVMGIVTLLPIPTGWGGRQK
ncbi:MAG: glycosyltransferase [Candidatus Marinimicrobia bacterium]|nr:hypothetical protein [Candidatus Neomarinimicrobiota bacterium]MDP6967429.1 glycosyltransferase [Candidatus Neomarinimicrobiota bacterium]